MRTTLKRSASRGASNGVPVFPPQPVVTFSRYAAPRRSRLAVVGRILLWFVVTVLVAVGGVAGGVVLWWEHSIAATAPSTPEEREAQRLLDAVPAADQPAVAMVIGYDKRFSGPDASNDSRSDTILLLRADPRSKTISMLSIPRDLYVDLAPCKGFGPRQGRINQAFSQCGPAGTIQTVRDLTHLPVNYFVTVNFRGFVKVVDKGLGGVYVDVDRRYFNDNEGLGPGETYATIDLHPGYQRLHGADALRFVRYRHTDNDFYRNARQQEFVKAVKQQISGLEAVWKLRGIVGTITRNVTIGQGGGGSIELETVLAYARFAYELPSGNFFQVRIQGLSDNGFFDVLAPQEEIDKAVASFMNPDPEAPDKAANAALGRKPRAGSRRGPPPSEVTVEVVNGNGVAGAADDAAYRLSERGYRALNGGNAARQDYFQTQILYDPAVAHAEDAARELAKLFGDATVEEGPPAAQLETTLRVIVGKTFGGTLAPMPRNTTPKHEPPKVVQDPRSAAPLVRAAQRKVDFPLLVPTVRETSSELSTLEPIRVYDVNDDHKGVRLVYNGPLATDYWGIQETSWSEAPILEGPTLTRTIGAREYRLYFNGSHLHMVAFEENGAVYWVSNTLLDGLSNETMLAIAKGLRPLRR
ncbi:MAG: LCP family protein [Actinomycetota bacterium]|nr:LCP family protein [Actinomycetota bacterium]